LWARLKFVAFALLAAASDAFAQGCSMCYSSAAQQDTQAQQALNLGILVLFLPPVLLFAGVLFTAFRRRHQSDSATDATD
ncbi:MAG: hypothetical protein ACRD5G_05955, partial [Candidatus Acidiferrales bacterium]